MSTYGEIRVCLHKEISLVIFFLHKVLGYSGEHTYSHTHTHTHTHTRLHREMFHKVASMRMCVCVCVCVPLSGLYSHSIIHMYTY